MGLYFIQAGDDGDIKVGQTADIITRLKQYRTHNSKTIYLLAWHLSWGYPEERALQKRLKAFRTEALNEWYSPTPEVLAALDECQRAITSDPKALYDQLVVQDLINFGPCDCGCDEYDDDMADMAAEALTTS